MRIQQLAATLSAFNLVLLVILFTQLSHPVRASNEVESVGDDVVPILRGRGLEIVDEQGRIRAQILVHPPTRVDGRDYPDTVLLRLTDPTSGPVVKLTAAANGAGLLLSDDADGGVQILARDTGTFLKLVGKEGRENVVKP